MRTIKDQLGIQRTIPDNPRRVISLVPSQSAYLAALGCDKQVVGITKFCVEPEKWFRSKTRIGGTKKLNHDAIRALKPDLIIGNKEENTQEDIEQLEEYHLWLSDISSLGDAIDMMASLGIIMGKNDIAEDIIYQTLANRSDFRNELSAERPSVAYLIWRSPYMLAGKDTFIDTMIDEAGFTNAVTESRYPTMTQEEIIALKPDYIFLSSEPYPFKEKHKAEWLDFIEKQQLILVNAVHFSWYGSHLKEAFTYFAALRQDLLL